MPRYEAGGRRSGVNRLSRSLIPGLQGSLRAPQRGCQGLGRLQLGVRGGQEVRANEAGHK